MSNAKIAKEIAEILRPGMMAQQEALVRGLLTPIVGGLQELHQGFAQAATQMRRTRRDTFATEAMKTLLQTGVEKGDPEFLGTDARIANMASVCYKIAAQMEKFALLSEQAEAEVLPKAVGSQGDEANQS